LVVVVKVGIGDAELRVGHRGVKRSYRLGTGDGPKGG